jgi:putative tricarboxylic transport membrane protein
MSRKIAALMFVALGLFAAIYSLRLKMYTSAGPGAGLFPLLIGIGLALTASAWFMQLVRQGGDAPEGPAMLTAPVRMMLQLGALIAFAVLMPLVGYVWSAIAVVVLTALIAGERSWFWIAVVAAISSVGLQWMFRQLGTDI